MSRTQGRTVLLAIALLYVIAMVRCAWVAEDAYIAFRTVDNAVHGFGLRWNIDERVQTYTCPLWVLLYLPAYAITHEPYYTCLVIQAVISTAAVGAIVFVGWHDRRCTTRAILAVSVLACSKAFVDFSTSGLENPLSHFIIVPFVLSFLSVRPMTHGRVVWLSMLAGLAAVNRLDAFLLYLPAVVWMMYESALKPFRICAFSLIILGVSAPLLSWLAFATAYYGCPFPNTAYAKLSTGIGAIPLLHQGINYLWNSLRWDPLTIGSIATLLILLAAQVRGNFSRFFKTPTDANRVQIRGALLAVGVFLYGMYVVKIGGDFMSGRFLTTPLVAAAAVFTVTGPAIDLRRGLLTWTAILMIGVLMPRSPLRSGRLYGWPFDATGQALTHPLETIDPTGVSDEREFFFPVMGLIAGPDGVWPATYRPLALDWISGGQFDAQSPPANRVRIDFAIGLRAYFGGPRIHYLDPLALGDALLARLPVDDFKPWRIGHFLRALPLGYFETVADNGRNHIVDPNLAKLYDDLFLATRASLFAEGRWSAIARLSLGRDDSLVDKDWYLHPTLQPKGAVGRPEGLNEADVALPPSRLDKNSTLARQR